MATDNGQQPDTGGMAGRLLLVTDADIPIVVQQQDSRPARGA
jgi:hypothetical protein